MIRLPRLSGYDVMKALERAGFRIQSQRGSHVKLRGSVKGQMRTVIVPLHNELAPGTLRSVLRQAALDTEELLVLLG